MERVSLYIFDSVIRYKGYSLVDELYDDADGFTKHNWMWGKTDNEYVYNPKSLTGISSNSYTNKNEAIDVFLDLVDGLI